MSFESISPNMSLPVPGVGLTDGPQYAIDLNECMNLIDIHDHSPGQGVQITADGININSEFPINDNNLTEVRSVRFTSQGSPLALPADLGCLYESGVDLYYNDGNGNAIRITQSGSVVGTPGSITALTAPASATYVAGNGTFVWQQAVNTAAHMDMASAIIRRDVASSDGVTIAAPVGLAGDYTISLPVAPPVVESPVTMDSSGNLLVTPVPAPNYDISASSGAFFPSSLTFVDITNMDVTLTTTGKPVYITVQPDGTASPGIFVTTGTDNLSLQIIRDASVISVVTFENSSTSTALPGNLNILDVPSPGTYTYKLQMKSSTGGAGPGVQNIVIAAFEIV